MKLTRMINKVYLLFILVFLLLILIGCDKKQDNSSKTSIPSSTVTVSRPLQKKVISFEHFSGVLKAVNSVTIRSRKEGVLEKIHFKPGIIVKKDDLLFSLESKPYQVKLKKAETEVAICEAELNLAKKTIIRLEKAYKKGAVSEIAVIEAEAKLSIAIASVMAARTAVDIAQLNLSYTKIKAPINGQIGRSFVDIGNLVNANEYTVLTSIVQMDPIYVYFRISERDFIKYKQMIEIQKFNKNSKIPVLLGLIGRDDYPFKGYIDYIGNCVDIESGTIKVRAVFPNSDRYLLPGSFARIKIPIGKSKKELLIPEKAFGLDQQGKYLLLVNADNKVFYQPVTVGELMNGMRVVTKGLSSDDLVVINGIQKAFPGFTIIPKEETLSNQ